MLIFSYAYSNLRYEIIYCLYYDQASCSCYLTVAFREDPFTRRPITITDIKFEMSCILYNIGALHSILGGMDTRQSPEVCFITVISFHVYKWIMFICYIYLSLTALVNNCD